MSLDDDTAPSAVSTKTAPETDDLMQNPEEGFEVVAW